MNIYDLSANELIFTKHQQMNEQFKKASCALRVTTDNKLVQHSRE